MGRYKLKNNLSKKTKKQTNVTDDSKDKGEEEEKVTGEYVCENGCGFCSNYDCVAKHEKQCTFKLEDNANSTTVKYIIYKKLKKETLKCSLVMVLLVKKLMMEI